MVDKSTYSPHDDSTNGVLAIALQNFKVKHVVITGHSQCVGCQQALNVSRLPKVPATTSLQRYIQPIAALASTLTTEDGPCTLDKLVEVRHIRMSDMDGADGIGECCAAGYQFVGIGYHRSGMYIL
jgi:carbonic anhydrase